MDYEIAIATRNRPDALRVSLPLFAGQSRPPRRIILVDASDDHPAIHSLCEGLALPVPLLVLPSEARNLAHQRNVALAHVTAPVVAMPDDDSFWYPDTAARIMELYEADRGGLIGGVTATEVQVSPVATATGAPQRSTRLVQTPTLARLRNRIEDRLAPHPFNLYGRERIARLGADFAAAGLDYPLVETLGGFRMSFRTDLVRALGFDATLGSRVGYSQHEDKDMSLRVLRAGHLLAAAPKARVFHNTHPGRRARGFAYGFFQIFNYGYVCAKVFEPASPARHAVGRYLGYKTLLYGLRRRDDYHRRVHDGARAALSELRALMAAPTEALPSLYEEMTARRLTEISSD